MKQNQEKQKEKRPKASAKDYIIGIGIGAVMAFVIMLARGVFDAEDIATVMKAVCDGFFGAGALLAGIAGLTYSSNEGTFDMLSFGVKQVVRVFTVSKLERQSFYDYRKHKMENPKPVLFLLLVGLGYLVLSGFFLLLYYVV